MEISSHVIVLKESSPLYRRRCKITAISKNGEYTVYSEGLEEEDVLTEHDFEPSKF